MTDPKPPNWWLVTGLAVLALVGGTVALWRLPWWLDSHWLHGMATGQARATTVSGLRTALVALGAGLVAVVGLFYTHQTWLQTRSRDSGQRQLTWEGQVTDRFSKAVGQIASDKPVEQLGGIYALERIMRDSEKDHATIVEILAAFVREHATAPVESTKSEASHRRRIRLSGSRKRKASAPPVNPTPARIRPTQPVQAALTVLGRRPDRFEPFRLDLRSTDLRGGVLNDAHLRRADLRSAHLDRADLRGAHLEGADLRIAVLTGADLRGTDLRTNKLTFDYLLEAYLDEETQLPADWASDPRILARIAEWDGPPIPAEEI